MLRKIIGPKRDEVSQQFRMLRKVELRDSYRSPGIVRKVVVRRLQWAGLMKDKGKAHNILTGKSLEKHSLRKYYGGLYGERFRG